MPPVKDLVKGKSPPPLRSAPNPHALAPHHSGGMHCIPTKYLRGKSGLSRVEIALLSYVMDNPEIQSSRAEIAKDCGCAHNSIPRAAKRLADRGLLAVDSRHGYSTRTESRPPKRSKRRKRRGLKKGEWGIIAAKSGGACFYCGARPHYLEADHVMPLARGGSEDIENFVAACAPCNREKSAFTVEDFLARRGAR